MNHTLKSFSRVLGALALVCTAAVCAGARDRDLARVVSAKAGGVNHASGDVTLRRAGATAWERLTTKDDLKSGDAVRTGADGRAEILLNPGSYLRLGHNTEFVFSEAKLDQLRLLLRSGSAVVEATGFSDLDVILTIETPEAQVAVLRSGLYRLNASRAGATEVFVHKGRASVRGVVVKEGRYVRVTPGAGFPEVVKFDKKQQQDALDLWSRERAKELARINDMLQRRSVNALLSHLNYDDLFFGNRYDRGFGYLGVWLWSPYARCYTFVPFAFGWPSPYGFYYGTGFGYFHAGFCTPCLHRGLRRRWYYTDNTYNSGWNTAGGGSSSPPSIPKSAPTSDFKAPSSSSADGGGRGVSSGPVGGGTGGKVGKP